MHMRRKKNLAEKLDNVSEYLLPTETDEKNFFIAANDPHYYNIKEIFKNCNPLHIEIGCGKGLFAVTLAKNNPNINIIAVERNSSVISGAALLAKQNKLSNLRFMRCEAQILRRFIPPNCAQRIYLNFSCPFPKHRQENLRLTNPVFLESYKILLSENGEIHQKTDNMHFFEYSLSSFSCCGFALKNISLDLKNSSFENNIETEYEKLFISKGFPIYRLEAFIK